MAICPLRPDLPAALLMSVGDSGVAPNYHWRADTPDRVNYKTLDDALTLCSWVVNRLTPQAEDALAAPGGQDIGTPCR